MWWCQTHDANTFFFFHNSPSSSMVISINQVFLIFLTFEQQQQKKHPGNSDDDDENGEVIGNKLLVSVFIFKHCPFSSWCPTSSSSFGIWIWFFFFDFSCQVNYNNSGFSYHIKRIFFLFRLQFVLDRWLIDWFIHSIMMMILNCKTIDDWFHLFTNGT